MNEGMSQAEGSKNVENRDGYWRCDQTRRIWYQQGQTPLDIPDDNLSRAHNGTEKRGVPVLHLTACTLSFVCACVFLSTRVFSISAQRPVL